MDAECGELNGDECNIEHKKGGETNEKEETIQNSVSSISVDKAVGVDSEAITKTQHSESSTSVNVPNLSNKEENNTEVARNADHSCENGKRKVKEEKPPTKVVVRRLPPLMTKENFLDQVSPLPPHDYMYFVNGDPSYGIYSFSRAYLNFINQEDVFTFTRTFDNYVFLDSKGQEFPAVVEFAPFQRVPKQRSKKKDTLTSSIESDPMYISFKENLLAEALENSKSGAKTVKQHYFETEISTTEEINTTPLLEFLKQRRAEKARIRDERREEKKRKEAERKLKQKTKDKKVDGDEEECTKDVKIHHSTVSAEKSLNKGEITLLLKNENEKVVKTERKEETNNRPISDKRTNTKESLRKDNKIIIKKRKDRSLEGNNKLANDLMLNKNVSTSCKNRASNKEIINERPSKNKQSSVSVRDCEDRKKSSDASQLNNSKIIENSNTGIKKAELQTQYLRKILGLSSQENNVTALHLGLVKSTSNVNISDSHTSTQNCTSGISAIDKTKQMTKHGSKNPVQSHRALWSGCNVNPALPCASFKSSTNLISHKNEVVSMANDSSSTEELKLNKKDNLESMQVNRPFRGEIVIDKALSTNNVLPSAFKKTVYNDQN